MFSIYYMGHHSNAYQGCVGGQVSAMAPLEVV